MKRKLLTWLGVLCVGLAVFIWYLRDRTDAQQSSRLPARESVEVADEVRPPTAPMPASSSQPAGSAADENRMTTISPSVRPLVDPQLSIVKRYEASAQLPESLEPQEVEELRAVLRRRGAQDDNQYGQSLKNAVMDRLCEMDVADLVDLLTEVYRDKGQNNVVRDYSLQHLIEYYRRRSRGEENSLAPSDWRNMSDLLFEAATETGSSIAGTALLGLSRLRDVQQEFPREKIQELAGQFAADGTSSELVRITAIQVSAQMGIEGLLPSIRQTAQSGQSAALQIAAIGALGLYGDSDSKAFLNGIVNGPIDCLKPSARQALSNIKQMEQEKAQQL